MDDPRTLGEQICELQGSLLAIECFLNSVAEAMPAEQRQVVRAFYASETEAFRAALMTSTAPEATVAAFERDVQRTGSVLDDEGDAGHGDSTRSV